MPNYKVLVEFELEGAVQALDAIVELSAEVAAPLLEEGKLELVGDQGSGEQSGLDSAAA